jgi:hypothetical protein
MINMSKSDNSQQTNTPQADVQPNSDVGLDDSLNPIFKAIADLQEAVKDLATAVTSGAEVQEGLEETLATKSAEVEELKSEVTELKKFAVGFKEAARENKSSDRFGGIGTPSKSESAKDLVTQESGNGEAGFPMISKGLKDVTKNVAYSVDTPRPTVEVGTRVQDDNDRAGDLIREVLDNKVKPMEAAKRAYNMTYGGN